MTEYSALLADLGEGKHIVSKSNRAGQGSSFSDTSLDSYQDLELSRPEADSTKSDIYAWAQVGIEIIRLNYEKLQNEEGRVLFPKKLMHLFEVCLSRVPKNRYEAVLLVRMLEEIERNVDTDGNAVGNESSWTEGSCELLEVRRRLATSLELSSSWMKTTGS